MSAARRERASRPLLAALRVTEISRWRTVNAIFWGALAQGSAVGLAVVAAWLIARAAGMPSPADLALAATIVRFFGIGRGLFRYVERLFSHDTALGGVARLRERVYDSLAASGADRVLALRRGDILARLGTDVDAIGDAWVRAVYPLGVALLISTASASISLVLIPTAGAVLTVCLAVAIVAPALLTWRSARLAARLGSAADARVSTSALSAIESAPEHRVWGTWGDAMEELRAADADAEAAREAAARPAALAVAVQALAAGAALIGSLVIAVTTDGVTPMTAAIVALLPLAAFESAATVPTAVMQVFRSREAAIRIEEITGSDLAAEPAWPDAGRTDSGRVPAVPRLEARGLHVGWPGGPSIGPIDLDLPPGGSLAVVGRSGIGKTTLLLTLAGALPPVAGRALIDGRDATAADVGHLVAVTAEDAHLFGTSVVENLRVADGDLTDDAATAALGTVGASTWVAGLPQGLDTPIGDGGGTVSGGERRRLLLARALLHPAPVQLLDEPAEHLDDAGVETLVETLRSASGQHRSIVVVTHDLALTRHVDRVLDMDSLTPTAPQQTAPTDD